MKKTKEGVAIIRRSSAAGVLVVLSLALPALGAPGSDGKRPPPTARKPQAVNDLPSAIDQTAVVVEGVVSNIDYEYSAESGPWTVVTLSSTTTHLGKAPTQVKIRQFGGVLPNGRRLVVAEHADFFQGKRYVVFLRNTAWNLSPVVGQLALRVETVEGREVLVNDAGQAVTGVGPSGLEFSRAIFQRADTASASPATVANVPEGEVRQTLDRSQFISSLRGTLQRQGLNLKGEFFDYPAGEFNWRRSTTLPSSASSGADSGQPPKPPERDTSHPPVVP